MTAARRAFGFAAGAFRRDSVKDLSFAPDILLRKTGRKGAFALAKGRVIFMEKIGHEKKIAEASKAIFRFAMARCGNTADAEDLLQEAYIKCILSLDTLQNPDAFYTWMWTILRNLRANNIRRQKYMVMSSDALAALIADIQ